jgi:hypothetical protein
MAQVLKPNIYLRASTFIKSSTHKTKLCSMENLAFCIKNSLLPTSSFGEGAKTPNLLLFGGGWEETLD